MQIVASPASAPLLLRPVWVALLLTVTLLACSKKDPATALPKFASQEDFQLYVAKHPEITQRVGDSPTISIKNVSHMKTMPSPILKVFGVKQRSVEYYSYRLEGPAGTAFVIAKLEQKGSGPYSVTSLVLTHADANGASQTLTLVPTPAATPAP